MHTESRHANGPGAHGRLRRSQSEGWPIAKKMDLFLELCVSSLRRGHANLLCIVPNFVNVFGFPLGRVLGESADMYTSDVIAQAVRGPIISEV